MPERFGKFAGECPLKDGVQGEHMNISVYKYIFTYTGAHTIHALSIF